MLALLALSICFISCRKENIFPISELKQNSQLIQYSKIVTNFPETFEGGSKTAYAAANVTLASGSWNLDNALLGTSSSDRKNGTKSVRIQSTGIITMNFDVTDGASIIEMNHGVFGSDGSSTFELWASQNAGSSWTQVGTAVTSSSTTLTSASFNANFTGNVRFQLRKTSGGRLNIDDFEIQDNSNAASQDDNMAMGNPSNAVFNNSFPNNYLMNKSQYSLSYNNSKGSPNWVSWHLSSAWKGNATRCDCFVGDNTLPYGFYKATTSKYTNTGFDRGHQCPSDDRDLNSSDNAATFLMTNIMPQAPKLNQITWANLETYCRTLINAGNELYIISGGYGSGGTGSNGGITYTIGSGMINVPSNYWKVIVVLPVGSNDVNRVSTSTRIIAVDMPNNQTVSNQPWGNYRVSVNTLETILGYDFLSNVPTSIQSIIEAYADNGPTN
ncbi:MAG: DNA/RNA non-specific endonuclease [Ferruginibacter sp.]